MRNQAQSERQVGPGSCQRRVRDDHSLTPRSPPWPTSFQNTIAQRVGRYLERQGLLVRDAGNSYLTAEGVDADSESPINQLLGSSITYRIAFGPQQGRKVFA